MALKKFQDFTPLNEDSTDARQAIADLANIEGEIAKLKQQRTKMAKDWAAASDGQRPEMLDELKKLTKEIREMELQANAAEDSFNTASGVTVIEEDDEEKLGEIEDEKEEEYSAPEEEGGEEYSEEGEGEEEEVQVEVPVEDLDKKDEIEEEMINSSGDYLVFKRIK